ncbi:DoxX family protein [Neolewinella antarctica]|uniref:Lipoprotein signal peptidase n=1 Tax=Neolewinella antarctica TaxID=442734 RepID=A0ABX0X790_9BACT|nr:DoxX family protein [Neolewinella antarctica]NJC24920.1 lipoprotein signal peptidase [Neolewinella antarctica]
MHYLIIALQLIVGLSILNVWLVQYNKDTKWRGGSATTIFEEFAAYGLPVWSTYVVGAIKVVLSVLLIVAIWFPALRYPAAIGLAAMLAGSVVMHFKIGDPLFKSFPAALFLVMCLIIAFVG